MSEPTQEAPQGMSTLVLTAAIVSAHVQHNSVRTSDVAGLIRTVHQALAGLGQPAASEPINEPPIAAVSVRKSLADPERILSMIDGKPYSTLKRHIGRHGYTPESYRAAFDLRPDYPMVAPAFAEKRRVIANQIGLGRKRAIEASAAKTGRRTARQKS